MFRMTITLRSMSHALQTKVTLKCCQDQNYQKSVTGTMFPLRCKVAWWHSSSENATVSNCAHKFWYEIHNYK